MFSYGQVEAALAKAHRVDAAAMGAFRGRIKHFRLLGVVPSSPGTGRKISYERPHIYAWAFCLELAEFGIDPKIIVGVWDKYWMRALGPRQSRAGSQKQSIGEILVYGTAGRKDVAVTFVP